MNEKTYKIKGLVWNEGVNSPSREIHYANTYLNQYHVGRDMMGCYMLVDDDIQNVDSIEDGKAKAETHWFLQILPALEEVKETPSHE